MRIHTVVAVLAATMFTGGSAWAGHPQDRQGFWIGFGAGYGSAIGGGDCEDCRGTDRQGAVTGFFKLGGTLSKQVLLGVEVNAWSKEDEGVRLTLGNVSGTVTIYPQASSGFFLKGGLGLGYADTSIDTDAGSVSLSKSGFGFVAGLGYDIRVGRNFSITPCANYFWGKPGDLTAQGDTLPGFKYNVFDFGIGFTFH